MNGTRLAELGPELRFLALAETGSTNDDARALATEGAPHGTAVVADHQRSGRGRLGRAWSSPPGANLLLSVILRENLDPDRLGVACLAAAVATAEVCGPEWRIKWPNDVVHADGRKVAGILAEAEWGDGRPRFVVVGVGVNVHARPPDLPAVALVEVATGKGAPEREQLAVDLVRQVLARAAEPAERVIGRWRARSSTLGQRVRVGDVEGLALDLDHDGALLVRDDLGAVRVVRSGDVAMIGTPRW